MSGLEIPLIAAEGMGGAAALDSLLINAGLPSLAGGAATNVAGGLLGGAAAKTPAQMMMAQMGMGMLEPQQPQMPMPGPKPPMGGQQSPLPMPYGPSGNSMGMPGMKPMPGGFMTEEEKRRRMMMGY